MKLMVDIQKKLRTHTLAASFEIEATTLGILGASGCGKSMLLKCIAGIETPDSGRIQLGERMLFDKELKINVAPQKRKVGLLFQQYALFPHLTVYKNLSSVTKNKRLIAELLELFHLETIQNSYPNQISGGQKQRVALARMLAAEPDLLLLDEPFSALDTSLKEELQLELQNRLSDFARNVLIVSHSLDELFRLCPKLMIMTEGACLQGETDTLFRQAQTVAAAKLTGCKNIFPIKRLDAHTVLVTGWSVPLTVAQEVLPQHSHIGIRAHDFLLNISGINQLDVSYGFSQQTPFEQSSWFSHKDTKLWWKGSKEVAVDQVKQLTVKPEAIMLLTE
ncbi:sulfate/molybdate ABC transporter ATP-binding protein [Enterococcus wangshanyuanii]|uniref:Molybdenum ABC transporter ATP-binding protein n=1 Tax=Enterococcus wangshanyuanii TaxID=2005703 RepID=A0ABQ1NHZ8_9ENTE|nr:ATP-binding cassette domain-containing protein [Enterococcus wangshanyuanii]GGC77630.1 molybdenum ABC transporter ATP-binding protein [Enterococcus wangshanyuanii]